MISHEFKLEVNDLREDLRRIGDLIEAQNAKIDKFLDEFAGMVIHNGRQKDFESFLKKYYHLRNSKK